MSSPFIPPDFEFCMQNFRFHVLRLDGRTGKYACARKPGLPEFQLEKSAVEALYLELTQGKQSDADSIPPQSA